MVLLNMVEKTYRTSKQNKTLNSRPGYGPAYTDDYASICHKYDQLFWFDCLT